MNKILVNKSYSKLKEICNHTFEDYDNAFECMNKFKKVNLKYLREHATALMNSGQSSASLPISRRLWL